MSEQIERLLAQMTLAEKISLTAGATTLFSGASIDEDITASTAMPFAFRFYDTAITHFAVSANGFVQLLISSTSTVTQSYTPLVIPSIQAPNGFIAPLWDDLIGHGTGSMIRQEVFGSSPNRRLVVEWADLAFLLGTSQYVTFQAKLFEGTNAIEFHYCMLSAGTGTGGLEQGSLGTVGVESLDGLSGIQHSFQQAVLTTTQAIHFE